MHNFFINFNILVELNEFDQKINEINGVIRSTALFSRTHNDGVPCKTVFTALSLTRKEKQRNTIDSLHELSINWYLRFYRDIHSKLTWNFHPSFHSIFFNSKNSNHFIQMLSRASITVPLCPMCRAALATNPVVAKQ